MSNSGGGSPMYSNGMSNGSPKSSSRQPTSADARAAAVHGTMNNEVEGLGMRKPTKLDALRLPTPKKGKKKKQQTWDNIDDF